MPGFRWRVYQAYRSTTSQNRYCVRRRGTEASSRREFANRWGRFLPADKTAPILDIACGGGDFLFYLRQQGCTRLEGVDLSLEQVDAANAVAPGTVMQTDVLSYLRNRHEQYAVISALSFLEHLTRDELFEHLDAVLGALQPGGLLLGLVPNAKGPFGAHVRYADITHELSFTPESVVQMAAVVGLAPVYIGECRPVPHGPVSLLRWAVWQSCRTAYLLARVAQAADGAYPVYTQDMRFVLRKPS